jgi:poly-gamma-glutamate synthesis protein (capsule biosynthesis protein)
MAVGDILLGDHPFCLGYGVDSMIKQKGGSFPFEHISSITREADVTFGNLEAVLSENGRSDKVFLTNPLRGSPTAVKGLVDAGFDVLSLANNHAMQYGEEGLSETIDLLSSNGIKAIGIKGEDGHGRPKLFEKAGLQVGFLAYCETQQYNLDCQRVMLMDLSVMRDDIESLRNKVDVVVVSLHWGDEFIDRPSPAQIKLGHTLINMGTNVVLGHHPHVLQGIEEYNGGIIAYSLGSLVVDLWQRRVRESVILDLKLYSGKIEMDLIPVFINEQYQPVLLEGEEGNDLLSRLRGLSSALKNNDLSSTGVENRRYIRDVARVLRQHNREKLWQYLKYLPKLDRRLLLQNIYCIIKRRVTGKML